jgi:hypothetical protein
MVIISYLLFGWKLQTSYSVITHHTIYLSFLFLSAGDRIQGLEHAKLSTTDLHPKSNQCIYDLYTILCMLYFHFENNCE